MSIGLSAHTDNRGILGDRLTDHGNVFSAGDENRSITLAADGEEALTSRSPVGHRQTRRARPAAGNGRPAGKITHVVERCLEVEPEKRWAGNRPTM
jgi:hypothetical protein